MKTNAQVEKYLMWYEKKRIDLIDKFPNKWIIISHNGVVLYGDDYAEMKEHRKEYAKIDPNAILIQCKKNICIEELPCIGALLARNIDEKYDNTKTEI